MGATGLWSAENQKIGGVWAIGIGLVGSVLMQHPWPMFVCIVLLWTWHFFWTRQRKTAFQRYAAERDFDFIGDGLVRSLRLDVTTIRSENYTVSNAVTGRLLGSEIVMFDVVFRRGKTSIRQTVVGFRPSSLKGKPLPYANRIGPFRFEPAGDWTIGYIPGRTVEVDELDAWCAELLSLGEFAAQGENREPDVSHLARPPISGILKS